jgi:membrane protease YdiL (CAAX protease family)
VRWPVGPLARVKQLSEDIIGPLFAGCSLVELAVLSLLAGIGEEALFRAVILDALGRHLGPVAGLLLSSLVFGLLHPLSTSYFVLATLLGLYLGCCWLITENLLVVIISHAFYDFVALVYLARRSPTITVQESESSKIMR